MPPDRPLVWLARHGETAWNRDGRIQGRTDVPLSETGRAQAAALAKRLAGAPPARIVSSDLARARETADAVAGPLGLPLSLDPELREQSLGAWEGLTFAEAAARDPEPARRFAARDPEVHPGGGESRAELQDRAVRALEAHAAPGAPGPLLLVSHGGVIQTILYRVLGLPLDALRRFLLPNAGLTTLAFHRGSWFVVSLSDVAHLPGSAHDTFPFE